MDLSKYESDAGASAPSAPASPSAGYPSAGNPATGTMATTPGAYWYYQIQAEMAAALAAAGLTPATASLAQLRDVIAILGSPVGSLVLHFGSTNPYMTLKANGAVVSRTAYARLFAVIGTTYGAGDGATTFALPDARAMFFRGLDDGRNVDPAPTRVVGSVQTCMIENHSHGYTVAGGTYPVLISFASGSIPLGNPSSTTAAAGGSETRPINMALLACIRY